MSRRTRRTIPVLAAVAAFGAPAAATAAGPARCPSAPEQTLVTWTTADAYTDAVKVRTTSRRSPLVRQYAPDPGLLSGLALAKDTTPGDPAPLAVVVRLDRTGHGRPAVCSGRTQVAALPALREGEIVASASVNGRRVAWRTARPGRPGRISTAVVQRRRAVRVTTATVPRIRAGAVSGAIHLLSSGTVAWTMGAGRASRGWVWPAGRAPIRLQGWPTGDTAPSIRVVDDRHVLVDGTLRTYRTPRPGSCPDVVGSRTTDLGGWRLSTISNGTHEDDQEFESSSTALVCDPASGAYVAEPAGYGGGTSVGDPSAIASVELHRAGEWLLSTVVPQGEAAVGSVGVRGRNLRTGERFQADGFLAIAGRAHPAEGARPPVSTASPRWVTGATAGPGMLAWCTPASFGAVTSTVWVWDADGTRPVAETTPTPAPADPGFPAGPTAVDPEVRTCGLGLDGTTLHWGPADAPRRLTLEPSPVTALG